MTDLLQFIIGGIATGSIYGLVALGFVLVFKSTDVFNFAHGDLMMLGAYVSITALVSLSLPFGPGILLVLGCAAALGVLIQVVVIRPMLGQPLLTVVMVTIALSLIIRAVVVIFYGPRNRNFPDVLPSEVYSVGALRISALDLTIIGVAFVCVLLFALFFRRSPLGLQMRATAENPEAAALSGINANRIFGVAFAIALVLATIGGVLLASRQLVSPLLGEIGLLAFPAAVIGGLTSIPGAIVGGIIIGVLENLAVGYVSSSASDLFVYGALLLVLLVRPYGLFGEREITRV